MKITYIHQYFATPKSSGGIRSYQIAKTLVENGHAVSMITSSAFVPPEWEINKGWNLIDCDGISTHVLHLPYSNSTSFLKRLYVFIVFMIRTTFKSISIKTDLVFATSTPLTVCVPGGICALLKRVPFIFEVRDVWPDIPIAMGYLNNSLLKRISRYLELWAYRRAKHIITLSKGMAVRIVRKGIPAEKVSTVENFSDNISFSNGYEFDSNTKLNEISNYEGVVLTYTGTFGHVNNLKYIIDLAASMASYNLDFLFVLVGDGKEKDELIEYALNKNVLDKTLKIFDPVRKEQLPWVLANSSASVSTVLPIKELWDNSANKFFDALAAGLPVIINHGGWQADLIKRTGCGIVLDESDLTKAAKQLYYFLSDKNSFTRAGKISKKLAIESYDTLIQTNKICKILEREVSRS